jgi:hypothetical protein
MIKWREAYERLRPTDAFQSYYKNKGITDFRYLVFSSLTLATSPLTPSASQQGGVPGTPVGPLQYNFPAGAVILGVTAAAYQPQQNTGVANYGPSSSDGRRDLFALAFQYTSDEQLTANGLTIAEALLGGGMDTIFPARELLIPPSQSILVTAASLVGAGGAGPPVIPVGLNLFVHVDFHAMVPRVVG